MCVQLDQVERECLHFRLRAFLQGLPSGAAELAHFRSAARLFTTVFAHAVQAVDAHIQDVVVAVDQPDRFLLFAVRIDLLQAAEHTDPMIDVHHQIAGFQLRELLQRKRLRVLAETLFQAETMVTFEDLVIGVERQFQIRIDEAFVQIEHQRRERHLMLHVAEDRVEALALFGVAARDQVGETGGLFVVQITAEHLEILGEGRLWFLRKVDRDRIGQRSARGPLHLPVTQQRLDQIIIVREQILRCRMLLLLFLREPIEDLGEP